MNSAGREVCCQMAYRAPTQGEGSTARERKEGTITGLEMATEAK